MSDRIYKLYLEEIQTDHTDIKARSISRDELISLPDNSIDILYGGNIMELSYDITELLDLIRSKLRMDGEFRIVGINPDVIFENYLDNILDLKFINDHLIGKKQQIFNINSITEILLKHNLIISVIKTQTIYYFIVAKRRQRG